VQIEIDLKFASSCTARNIVPQHHIAASPHRQPDLVANDLSAYWVYVTGPLLGAVLALDGAFLLPGRGGGLTGSQAAQGALLPKPKAPDKA
jgi:hypothetical protein